MQRELLLDQLIQISNSALGRKFLGDSSPKTVSNFRRSCPLTTYGDYSADLERRDESCLSEHPEHWVREEGLEGLAPKRVPYTKRGFDTTLDNALAAMILSSANRKAEVNLRPQDRMLWTDSEPSSLLNLVAAELSRKFGFGRVNSESLVEQENSESSRDFDWGKGMTEGIDILLGSAAQLTHLGRELSTSRPSAWIQPSSLHPLGTLRLGKGYVKSRLSNRKMMPKDLWAPKVLVSWQEKGAMDDLQTQIEAFWGKSAYEPYFCPEGGILGLPGWNRRGTTLIPYSNFYEFIPEDEYLKSWQNPDYRPKTMLFHELEEGEQYELVITSFHGMPFLRYRVGHLIRVVATSDERIGVSLPQIEFQGRCDQRIQPTDTPLADEPEPVGPALIGWPETVRSEFATSSGEEISVLTRGN